MRQIKVVIQVSNYFQNPYNAHISGVSVRCLDHVTCIIFKSPFRIQASARFFRLKFQLQHLANHFTNSYGIISISITYLFLAHCASFLFFCDIQEPQTTKMDINFLHFHFEGEMHFVKNKRKYINRSNILGIQWKKIW